MATKTAPAPAPIASVHEHEELQAAQQRLRELEAEHRQARQRLQELDQQALRGIDNIEDQVKALLDGGGASALGNTTSLNEERAELRRKVRIYETAIEQQRTAVDTAQRAARAEVRVAIRKDFRPLLERMAAAAVAFGQLADEAAAFREDALRHRLAASALEPQCGVEWMEFPSMELRRNASRINRWLDELEEHYGIKAGVKRESGTSMVRAQPHLR